MRLLETRKHSGPSEAMSLEQACGCAGLRASCQAHPVLTRGRPPASGAAEAAASRQQPVRNSQGTAGAAPWTLVPPAAGAAAAIGSWTHWVRQMGPASPQQQSSSSGQCLSYITNDAQLIPVLSSFSSYLLAQSAVPHIARCVVQMLLLTACNGAGCVTGAGPPRGVLQSTRMMGGRARFVSPSASCCLVRGSVDACACLTTWSGLSAAKLHHQESLIGQECVGQRHLRNRTVMTPTTDQVRPLMCYDAEALLCGVSAPSMSSVCRLQLWLPTVRPEVCRGVHRHSQPRNRGA